MPPPEPASLWTALGHAASLAARALWGAEASVSLGDLVGGSSLGGHVERLRDRAILITTRDQLTAALALIELDGIAARIVLCPPDLPVEHVPYVATTAAADAQVFDGAAPAAVAPGVATLVACTSTLTPGASERAARRRTEWILLTSGTTGRPKLVAHTLSTLAAPIIGGAGVSAAAVWATFYDIRRYGGLQIFLRALLGGGSMVLSSPHESTADFLARAGRHGVTHISGTPSHWRRALMSAAAHSIAPRYVRLSGEIADQAILDRLRARYPDAQVAHAFASTEAGVAFDVRDGGAGFPASLIGARADGGPELKVEDGSLRIRSPRTASRYLDERDAALLGADGFVDTGDMVERRGDRYYFVGRRGGVVNVGGLKVHPEEVEAVLNSHPRVRMSRVRTRKNPITGALVVADVELETAAQGTSGGAAEVEQELLRHCRQVLPRHKIPAAINLVAGLGVNGAGKLVRRDA
jgi:acyl-coenzyme A synthetase/AMP-(fatty) acid ligase